MNRVEAEVNYGFIKISAFRSLILKRDKNSEIAAFYMLRHTVLYVSLKQIFRDTNLNEEFDDVLSDFYLYLRDGKDNCNKKIFEGLEGIRSYFAFESWIKNTFKFFVNERLTKEIKTREAAIQEARLTHHYNKRKDQEIHFLGQSIAIFNANESPLYRFIFYRNLLSKLNKDEVIENERMAGAMGISYDNYRQIDARNKSKILKLIAGFEKGEYPTLNEEQKTLSEKIELEFENLRSILKDLYDAVLEILPCKAHIDALREEDCCHDEDDNDFEFSSNIRFRLRSSSSSEEANSIPQEYLQEIKIDFSDLSPQRQIWMVFYDFLNENLPEKD